MRDTGTDDEEPTRPFVRPMSQASGSSPANHRGRSDPSDTVSMLTVKEAAELLRVNVKTIHKLLASGDLPHHRFGRVIRIPSRVLTSTRKSV
jgi:excisionase family DNA binding protein